MDSDDVYTGNLNFVWFVVRLVRRSSGSVDLGRPKIFLGAIAPKKILNLFSGSVDPGSVDPGRPKISAKISDFGENLGFWRKSRILAKISDFGENLGLWRKSRALAKISDFGENLGRFRFNLDNRSY